MTIQGLYNRWFALRAATETADCALGAALVAEMTIIETAVAARPGNGLWDVRCKLAMAKEGVAGMVESALADLEPLAAAAE